MSLTDILTTARNEVGASKHIPITHLNDPTVFEASNTMVGSVIKIQGAPFDTEKDEVLNRYKATWHRALSALGEEFCVYVTLHRRKENIELSGEFSNDFARELDKQYHAQFRNNAMYINDIYITLIYKGITAGKTGKGLQFLHKVSDKAIKSAREAKRELQVKALKKATQQLTTSLAAFDPKLLGTQDDALGYSELLTFFGLLVNAGEIIKFNFTTKNAPLDKKFAFNPKLNAQYPYGNIAGYITSKRIFFGENIQWLGANKNDVTFATIITIKRYSNESASIMLDPLLHLDSEFISTNTFAFESKDIAQKHMQQHIIKMGNVNDPAISQIEQLNVARDMLASDEIAMGYHHNTVMLFAKTQRELENKVTQAIKCYADAGFVAVKETLGQEPAFWAQIPTNMKYIARSAMITSQNFVDFCPLHNYRTGYRDGNHLGSAVNRHPNLTPFRR